MLKRHCVCIKKFWEMSKYLKKIFEYSGNTLFNKLLLLLLLPLFTRWLVPEEYAIYTNLLVFTSFVGLIYMLGQQQAVFSYFYNKKSKEYHFTYISSIFITIISIGILLSILIIIFRYDLSIVLLRSSKYAHLFIPVSIVLFCDVLLGLTLSILNIMEMSSSYLKIGIIKNILFFLLILSCIIFGGFSIEKIFSFLAISSFTSAVFGLIAIKKVLKTLSDTDTPRYYYSFKLVRKLLGFGVIMIPGTLALISLRLSDRLMLTYFSPNSLYDVGIYSVGYKIGMIITIVNSLVSLVFFPYAMKKDSTDAKKVYKKLFNYYVLFGGFVGLIVVILAPEIFRIFIDSSYSEAIKLVIFGVVSNFLLGIYSIINLGLYMKHKAMNISVAVAIGAISNLILNYLLIPTLGVYGAGYASIIAYSVIVVINYYFSRKVFPVNYKIEYVMLVTLLLIAMSFLVCYLPVTLIVSVVKVVIILIILYIIFKYIMKSNDKIFIRKLFVQKN